MLWTVFKSFMVVWMLQLVLRFGGSAMQVVLVVSFAGLLLRLGIPRISFHEGRRRVSNEDRKAQFHSS